MTLTLFESIQQIVREEVGRVRTAELATVQKQHAHTSSGDSDNYACTVVLRDSGIVLARVPVATERIGSASIPAVGELVLVQFLNGDVNSPVIVGRLYNDADRPPPNDDGQAILHLPLGRLGRPGGSRRAAQRRHAQGDHQARLRARRHRAGRRPGREGRRRRSGGPVDRQGRQRRRSRARPLSRSRALADVKIEASGQLTLKGATVNIN